MKIILILTDDALSIPQQLPMVNYSMTHNDSVSVFYYFILFICVISFAVIFFVIVIVFDYEYPFMGGCFGRTSIRYFYTKSFIVMQEINEPPEDKFPYLITRKCINRKSTNNVLGRYFLFRRSN